MDFVSYNFSTTVNYFGLPLFTLPKLSSGTQISTFLVLFEESKVELKWKMEKKSMWVYVLMFSPFLPSESKSIWAFVSAWELTSHNFFLNFFLAHFSTPPKFSSCYPKLDHHFSSPTSPPLHPVFPHFPKMRSIEEVLSEGKSAFVNKSHFWGTWGFQGFRRFRGLGFLGLLGLLGLFGSLGSFLTAHWSRRVH